MELEVHTSPMKRSDQKMFNLNLMMKKQANLECGTFYKTTGPDASNKSMS